MASLTYGQLINEGMRLYRDGKYAEAYELITAEASRLEGKPAQALNFRFDLASRAGRHDLALRIMH